MKWVALGIFVVIVLLGVAVMGGCATGRTTTHKSSNLTCLGFCTNTAIEHDTDVYPPKENP